MSRYLRRSRDSSFSLSIESSFTCYKWLRRNLMHLDVYGGGQALYARQGGERHKVDRKVLVHYYRGDYIYSMAGAHWVPDQRRNMYNGALEGVSLTPSLC